jgi:uncharacterized repeat protein (TIGR03803 family)
MHIFTVSCRAFSICAAALLSSCGGSQPPLSVSRQVFASQPSSARQTYNILHKFGGSGDGWYPSAALINVRGTLYGTTAKGGSHNAGTVFSITKSGEETILHSFGGRNDGVQPFAPLIDVNGTLYGTTSVGGLSDAGTVFSITPAGNEKVLYSFSPGALDGSMPYAGLIDVKGTLYGTTSQGGDHTCGGISCGTVFSITTSGTEKVLYSFGRQATSRNGNDGSYPVAELREVSGLLYGTTSQGGKYGRGTVFDITIYGGESVLYSFGTRRFFDGTDPSSALINVNGTLYGTTVNGGAYDDSGTVLSITTGGREKVIHSFSGSDGSWPYEGLIDVRGALYGTTSRGGVNNAGTVFSMTTSGKENLLHSFGNGSGKHPVAELLELGGRLYGTTYGVTARRSGNVFSLTP